MNYMYDTSSEWSNATIRWLIGDSWRYLSSSSMMQYCCNRRRCFWPKLVMRTIPELILDFYDAIRQWCIVNDVRIGHITFDCCFIVTTSDDVNGKLIEINWEKFQYLKPCNSRTECRLEIKKICIESCLGHLYFLPNNYYFLTIFCVA